MKKILFLLIGIGVLFSACSKDDEDNNDGQFDKNLVGIWEASYQDSFGQYIKEELTFNQDASGLRYQEIRLSSPTSEFYSTSELEFDKSYVKNEKIYFGYDDNNLVFSWDLISLDEKNLIIKEDDFEIKYKKKQGTDN